MYAATKGAIKSAVPPPIWRRVHRRHYRSIRPLTVDYCPVRLPWMPRSSDSLARVQRFSTEFTRVQQTRQMASLAFTRYLDLAARKP